MGTLSSVLDEKLLKQSEVSSYFPYHKSGDGQNEALILLCVIWTNNTTFCILCFPVATDIIPCRHLQDDKLERFVGWAAS